MSQLWNNVKGLFQIITGRPSDSDIDSTEESTSDHDSGDCARKEQQYRILLNLLELNPHKKFTLKKARTVDNNTINDKALTSTNEIPIGILLKN